MHAQVDRAVRFNGWVSVYHRGPPGVSERRLPAASWQASAQGVVYSASKHAVLGLARAMYVPLSARGIRMAVVHPFFTDTGLMTTMNRIAVAGIPLLPIERVAGTILFSSTDPNIASTGAVWLLPDDGPLLRLEKEIVKGGVYDVIAERNRQFIW